MEDFGNRDVVIKALVGSHNYNLATPDSDKDYKYFVTPTFDDLYHGKMFSTAIQSDKVDYDCHDIRQLGNLLWKANLNFIEVLFSTEFNFHPDLSFLFLRAYEFSIMNLPAFFNATYGMHLQKMKELEKGTAKTDVLVEQFGYDTKQALHALRCLFVLQKVAWGQPFRKAIFFEDNHYMRDTLLGIKAGNLTLEQFKEYVSLFKAAHLPAIREFFADTEPIHELKAALDLKIKMFIRTRL